MEEIAEPLTRNLRLLDKLIDELAKGKAIEKILRQRPVAPPCGRPFPALYNEP